ncbi:MULTISPECIES: L-2-hydroxyglutarate oxidase [unclassified Synechocystis]|uniref:L-2-hydroxyglutarate oxidase n=1 Tax=unclassified Synechocystis TaxID=2640012 RepID=UPI000408E5BA|nr:MULTISPECIES: L-2-hydroxyglutarate oxidase [unclassified Synechocystis]AIE75337.1 L-2-hydroxyglutarate oxidase [Synechocystis sp. PCC 6714]MCT0253573.1 L-2-hydroxyglutarate oxidase [Synechocystis sp. CS-94]
MASYDITIIGGGIVGLATGLFIGRRFPQYKLLILEKEDGPAHHQTGHNSGVIHSGIYYKPGSFKAQFTKAGNQSMVQFCQEHELPHEVCGKVIVATKPAELPLLENLFNRGQANGLSVKKLTFDQVREYEPHVQCLGGIYVPTSGIVNYKLVCQKYAELIQAQGGEIKFNHRVHQIETRTDGHSLQTNQGDFFSRFLINCGGLQSDRLAKMAGIKPEAKIVPFRGEYYELKPEKRYLVKGLIYPVPNPAFPFLGVHFTRMIDGSIHAGPNAVLSLKREGYEKTDFNWADFTEVMTYPGFWRLVGKHWQEGLQEIIRSFSKAAFVRSLQELIPEVTENDIVPNPAGVRAQALKNDGALVEDFLIAPGPNSLQVLNAPSPAATASLEIGKAIAAQVQKYF